MVVRGPVDWGLIPDFHHRAAVKMNQVHVRTNACQARYSRVNNPMGRASCWRVETWCARGVNVSPSSRPTCGANRRIRKYRRFPESSSFALISNIAPWRTECEFFKSPLHGISNSGSVATLILHRLSRTNHLTARRYKTVRTSGPSNVFRC